MGLASDPFAGVKGSGGIPETRVPEDEEDCPICYEKLSAAVPRLTYCQVAGGDGKALHNECAQQ